LPPRPRPATLSRQRKRPPQHPRARVSRPRNQLPDTVLGQQSFPSTTKGPRATSRQIVTHSQFRKPSHPPLACARIEKLSPTTTPARTLQLPHQDLFYKLLPAASRDSSIVNGQHHRSFHPQGRKPLQLCLVRSKSRRADSGRSTFLRQGSKVSAVATAPLFSLPTQCNAAASICVAPQMNPIKIPNRNTLPRPWCSMCARALSLWPLWLSLRFVAKH